MKRTIGRNTSKVDTAELSGLIDLNSITAVKIADALDFEEKPLTRLAFIVSNPNNTAIFIKPQAAAIDNLKNGIWIPKFTVVNIMPEIISYTGEISAIAEKGNPEIFWTKL